MDKKGILRSRGFSFEQALQLKLFLSIFLRRRLKTIKYLQKSSWRLETRLSDSEL
jgi:hypothetical protein